MTRRYLPVLLLLFIGSGCAALVYEIVWFQLLQMVIGSSAVSLGVLLGTFMGGMCLGSLLLPRFVGADRHPLRVYAALELGIGLIGVLVLFGMPLVGGAYTAWAGSGLTGILLRGVAAGVCLNLEKSDYLTSTHRGHGHTLAKGASMERTMCELFGKATGFNGGKGGSMHIADFSVGMLGANGVVAAGIPIAVGAAHAIKIRKEKRIVACFFGDGAINRGPFLEGLNWAKVHALPILFVCEDNRWSATTSTEAMTAGPGPLARAKALGLAGM